MTGALVPRAARRWAVALLLAQGFLLLVPALQSGRIAEPDEAHYVETALRMPKSGFDPGTYLHGSLPFDLLALEMGSLYAASRATGRVASPQEFATAYLDHPERFLVAARLLVLVTFLLGMWGFLRFAFLVIGDPWLAVAAGALLLTSPAILFCCWFVKAEAFALTGLAWAAFLAVAARGDSTPPAVSRRFPLLVGSAACFGLAVSAGYLAVLAAPMLALLIWPSLTGLDARERLIRYGVYGTVSLLAFALAEPYGLLHLDRLLAEVSRQQGFVASTEVPTVPLWGKILGDYYARAMGLPTSLAVLAAVVASAIRIRKTSEHWPWALLAYPLLTFLYFGPARGAFYRYFALTIPFLLLFLALQIDRLAPRVGSPRRLVILAMTLLAILQARASWSFGSYLAQPSTATAAKGWIESHIPPGSPIVVEGLIVDQVFWCPQIPKTLAALERELADVRSRGGSGGLVTLKIDRSRRAPDSGFDVEEVPTIEGSSPAGARFAVLCLDDLPPFQLISNVEPATLARATRERAQARQRWLKSRECQVAHSSEPSVRTSGPLIDVVDFAALQASEHGQAFSGPRITIFRCGSSQP